MGALFFPGFPKPDAAIALMNDQCSDCMPSLSFLWALSLHKHTELPSSHIQTLGMHACKCVLVRIQFSLHALRTYCAHDRLVGLAQRQGPGDVTGVEARDLAAKEDAQSRESTKEHSRAHPEKMQTLENQDKRPSYGFRHAHLPGCLCLWPLALCRELGIMTSKQHFANGETEIQGERLLQGGRARQKAGECGSSTPTDQSHKSRSHRKKQV